MMRSMAQYPTNALAKYLHLPRGSMMSNYFKVTGAFFWACVAHAYGTYVAGGNPMVDFWHFGWQIVAIFVEERVVDAGKQLGIKKSGVTKAAGCSWTLAVLTITLRPWLDEQARFGAFVKPPFPVSPVEMMVKKFGIL